MGRVLRLTDIRQFAGAGRIPEDAISEEVRRAVSSLDERQQIEPWLREVLHDPNVTPHGPTEIADVLTTRVEVAGVPRLAALVIKGRSLPKVSSKAVTHQLAKVRQLPGLELLVLLAVGNIQDDAFRDFVQTAEDAGCDYLIIDKVDVARLFISLSKLCPKDGMPYANGVCPKGHHQPPEIQVRFSIREDPRCEIVELQDYSHAGAKRLSATLLVDAHYTRDTLRQLLRDTVDRIRRDPFVRNELVRAGWGDTAAHVVWLYVANDAADVANSNWICRACWIDPDLEPSLRPAWDASGDAIDGVMIVWNPEYHAMKAAFSRATGSKSAVVHHVEACLKRLLPILESAVEQFDAFCQGRCDENRLIATMRGHKQAAESIYREGTSGPLPPPECADYEQCFQSMLAHFHNLWLFYTEDEFLRRDTANRRWLFQDARGRIEVELKNLDYEGRKIGLT